MLCGYCIALLNKSTPSCSYISDFFTTLTYHMSLRIESPKSPGVHSGPLYKRFRTFDPQRNVMGQKY